MKSSDHLKYDGEKSNNYRVMNSYCEGDARYVWLYTLIPKFALYSLYLSTRSRAFIRHRVAAQYEHEFKDQLFKTDYYHLSNIHNGYMSYAIKSTIKVSCKFIHC